MSTPVIAPASPATGRRFYLIPEVAAELRRSESSIRWMIRTGALKSSKLAGRRVVTHKQLDDFFNEAFGTE